MATKKKKTEKKPDVLWVRIKEGSNLAAGIHQVGPFETKVGDLDRHGVSREWQAFDGTWATGLKKSHLSHKFEFSSKDPNSK